MVLSTTKNNKNHENINSFVEKLNDIKNIIVNTFISIQRYKTLDIVNVNDITNCINLLERLNYKIKNVDEYLLNYNKQNEEKILLILQEIINELSTIFKNYGTNNIDDLINICFGKKFVNKYFDKDITNKYEIIKKYLHPFSYKITKWKKNENYITNLKDKKKLQKDKLIEENNMIEHSVQLECFDLSRTSNSFQTKIYGIKFVIQNPEEKNTMTISCIFDDIALSCVNSNFISNKLFTLNTEKHDDDIFFNQSWERYINNLTIKDILVYSNNELYHRFAGFNTQIKLIKQTSLSTLVSDFVGSELYSQRDMLIKLLIWSEEQEFQYIAYLLYDLLSNDNNGVIDTQEQTILYDSLPWTIKKYFKDAMKQTITYTNTLCNFDNNKIPLEQQICLMKVNDSIKEKAMLKLKEVKTKSDDSGSKARQYLDGLLKIPFGIYKEEQILLNMKDILKNFKETIQQLESFGFTNTFFPNKENYNSLEFKLYYKILKEQYFVFIKQQLHSNIIDAINNSKREQLINLVLFVNNIIKSNNLQIKKTCHSGKNCTYMRENTIKIIEKLFDEFNINIIIEILNKLDLYKIDNCNNVLINFNENMDCLSNKYNEINDSMTDINNVLDEAVYGHDKAKRQVERIIGQWINGEKSGYCFGFEGPPGVGKTSLAKKGIANCLKDHDGNSRPFSFIAVGGSSNGSTLEGHNYTYVGSSWGRIVDILIEKKCMNPIIFIDELDKISRTENGRELIGILTHMIDPTQNDSFQDKYFNGIDIDLSKVLFIFSYNDIDVIDRILLDRIHRVKFDSLSLNDKIIITKKYILPEIYTKMGLNNTIDISDEIIEYIIDKYTSESGVRKLKEILFEIVSEINLNILKNSEDYTLPIIITKHDIKHKYLKERHTVKKHKIHDKHTIGLINGLWANAIGKGGVLPIEANLFPTNVFMELKLTGMQGDVMKESMNVAKTLSWNLLPKTKRETLKKSFIKDFMQGLHIHVPEGATPKDGPSAGTAITVVMYSLFSGHKIKNDVAITGEICLQGKVTAIGGLNLKILGGIKAGVKHFLYPKENQKDFDDFYEKYENKSIFEDIVFDPVENIDQVLKLVLI